VKEQRVSPDRPTRKQATPVELAAILAESVFVPGEGERQAVEKLAELLEVKADVISEELLYLRAFAVDFAVLMSLGDSPAKDQILSGYYEHWQRIDADAPGTMEILEERLRDFAAIVGDIELGAGGLTRQLGITLAARCQVDAGPAAGELMVFGGRLFAVLYEELTALLTEVEIVLLET
jgi:hypothetical protein